MIREIVKGEWIFVKAKRAARKDIQVANDLEETLNAHRDKCVGMAANMIGENLAIIAVRQIDEDQLPDDEGNVPAIIPRGNDILVMLNPQIVKQGKPYRTEEGCLSLDGEREAVRYENITVAYQDRQLKKHTESFSGFTAQIIQHECDHINGKVI